MKCIQFEMRAVKAFNRNGEEVEYVNIYGLGEDGQMYEWFKNPGEWRLLKTQPRDEDAF